MNKTLLAALLCSLVAISAQAQTVTNGSMTGPPAVSIPPPGWTNYTIDGDTVPPGGISFYGPSMTASPDGGTMLMILDNSGGPSGFDSVGQVIAGFTPTATYTVDFYFSNGGLNPASVPSYQAPGSIQVDIAGSTFNTPVVNWDGAGAQQWYSASFQFTAVSPSETLLFTPNSSIVGEGFAGAVDGVRITVVPEPSVVFALGGIVALGVVAYSRRRQRPA